MIRRAPPDSDTRYSDASPGRRPVAVVGREYRVHLECLAPVEAGNTLVRTPRNWCIGPALVAALAAAGDSRRESAAAVVELRTGLLAVEKGQGQRNRIGAARCRRGT